MTAAQQEREAFQVGDLVIDLNEPERGLLRVWFVSDGSEGPEPGWVYLGEPDEGTPWEHPCDFIRVTVPPEVSEAVAS